MDRIRSAIDYAEHELGIDRLLLRDDLRTAPGHIFLDRVGELVNLSQAGQLALRKVLGLYLRRVERDDIGLPTRLYPLIPGVNGAPDEDRPGRIVIDPRLSFGRPVVETAGVSTAILRERIDAGEEPKDVADDYQIAEEELEEAILFEELAA